jgi:signal transduction histidine kinase
MPLVLGNFWCGLKGAIAVSFGVSILYLPYVLEHWQGWYFEDFDRLLEGILYVAIAFILGFLVEKERKLHNALLRSESLAAVGHAVSEIAHDMKTPLMAIGGFAGQVSRVIDREDPNRRKLDIVIRETARLETMVKEMLDFGRPLEIQPGKIDLNKLVLESVEVTQTLANEAGVVLDVHLTSPLPLLSVDEIRVKQALTNLLTNAVQASPAGECVWARTGLNRGEAMIEVVDCGCGIKKEHNDMVFQPFFSSKEDGSGLGLAIVKKIVEAHGGRAFFSPNPEKGVTFTLSFPV